MAIIVLSGNSAGKIVTKACTRYLIDTPHSRADPPLREVVDRGEFDAPCELVRAADRESLVDAFVRVTHACGAERHGMVAAFVWVDLVETVDGIDHLIDVVADESGDAIDDDLGHRSASKRDHGRAR